MIVRCHKSPYDLNTPKLCPTLAMPSDQRLGLLGNFRALAKSHEEIVTAGLQTCAG